MFGRRNRYYQIDLNIYMLFQGANSVVCTDIAIYKIDYSCEAKGTDKVLWLLGRSGVVIDICM